MNISQEGKEFLTREEGGMFRHAYMDSGGEPTIGVGHLLTHSERASGKIVIGSKPIKYRDGLTPEQGYELLDQDLDIAENAVNRYVTVPLAQNQFDTLVSFVFNVGVGAFIYGGPGGQQCTLLRLLNQGDYHAVPQQLRLWIYDDGKVVQGLINRRQHEIDFWNEPVLVAV